VHVLTAWTSGRAYFGCEKSAHVSFSIRQLSNLNEVFRLILSRLLVNAPWRDIGGLYKGVVAAKTGFTFPADFSIAAIFNQRH